MMKKLICMLMVFVMALVLLSGCGQEAQNGNRSVAIVQQLDHSSMDQIRQAMEAQLKKDNISYKVFNGQNDATVLNQIGAQVVSGGYSAILPIGTLAAQCMANAADGQNIPVIYAAVSDPKAAGLTGLSFVTGTSDALNTAFILDMMLAVSPGVKTVGLLYSNSEPNSETPIAQAKIYLKEKGIAWIEKTGNTAGEILDASNALAGRVDAVFTPTDNVVMASESAVAEIFTAAGIPHYTGADSFVTSGAFATCGVSYDALGQRTAEMAAQVLETGNVPEFQVLGGDVITVSRSAAQKLKLDYSPFQTLGENLKIVEVD